VAGIWVCEIIEFDIVLPQGKRF